MKIRVFSEKWKQLSVWEEISWIDEILESFTETLGILRKIKVITTMPVLRPKEGLTIGLEGNSWVRVQRPAVTENPVI